MSGGFVTGIAHPARMALGAAGDALSDLAQANLWSMSERELLELRVELESFRARVDSAVLAATREVDARGAAVATGAASTAAWLRGRLRLHPRTADVEVKLATALDRDRAATGAALARGEVTLEQAEVVVAGIRALPGGVDGPTRSAAEGFLLEQAGLFDPMALSKLSRHAPRGRSRALGPMVRRTRARRGSAARRR